MWLALPLFIFLLLLFPFLLFSYRVIFFPTEKVHLEYLKRNISISDSDIIYDLGCGNGRILKYLITDSKAKGIGIELSPILYLISKLRLRKFKNINVVWGDFFKVNLSEASLVYCFLNQKVFKKIAPQLKTELRPGTKIISYITEVETLKQVSVIKDSAGQNLFFVYEI